MNTDRYDLLYTWVDDSFPGFNEERASYARTAHDLNPERTRDNLDILKYSLRSIERFAPWAGKIFIVTCRPQVPRWLRRDHPNLRLVYLDEFMPAELLPSFNAYAIESYIHTIPELSQRYIHFNDDMLLTGDVQKDHFVTPEGRLRYYFSQRLPHTDRAKSKEVSPHEGGRTIVARLLEQEFGPGRYPQQAHHPRIVDKRDMETIVARFPEAFARTRKSRFRGFDNVLPHMLLAAYKVRTGQAEFNGRFRASRLMRMVKLHNSVLENRARLALAAARRPRFLALNDDFGLQVSDKAEAVAKRFLERMLPGASSYETPDSPNAYARHITRVALGEDERPRIGIRAVARGYPASR